MSRLIARILLAILIFPFAALVYLVVFVWAIEAIRGSVSYRLRDVLCFGLAGLAAWAFMAGYWFLLWRKSVRWTPERRGLTAVAAGGAVVVGLIAGGMLAGIEDEVGAFVGTATAPLVWLAATILIWRESAAERAARISGYQRQPITCPHCGYNLTGLSEARCPECGTRYTLDELLAVQPGKAELGEEAAAPNA